MRAVVDNITQWLWVAGGVAIAVVATLAWLAWLLWRHLTRGG